MYCHSLLLQPCAHVNYHVVALIPSLPYQRQPEASPSYTRHSRTQFDRSVIRIFTEASGLDMIYDQRVSRCFHIFMIRRPIIASRIDATAGNAYLRRSAHRLQGLFLDAACPPAAWLGPPRHSTRHSALNIRNTAPKHAKPTKHGLKLDGKVDYALLSYRVELDRGTDQPPLPHRLS
jgi:hypothetical protein